MNAAVCNGQKGIVEEITDHTIRVKIAREASCSNCSVHGMCNLGETDFRIIETKRKTDHPETPNSFLKTGDEVEVFINPGMGRKAVLLGYFFPFVVMFAALFILSRLSANELLMGLLSLAFVALYFFILHFFKDQLRKTFRFTVKKTV